MLRENWGDVMTVAGSERMPPERKLALALLVDAIDNIREKRVAPYTKTDYKLDIWWMTRGGSGFEEWCDTAGVDPEVVRTRTGVI